MDTRSIEILIQEGRYQEARGEIVRLLDKGSKSERYRALLLKARLMLQQGLNDDGFELLEQLQSDLEKEKHLLPKSTYLSLLIEHADLMLNGENKTSAQQLFERIISILEQSAEGFSGGGGEEDQQTSDLLAKAYLGLARSVMELGPHDRVGKLLVRANENARKSENRMILLSTLNVLANWFLLNGDVVKVRRCLKEIRNIEREVSMEHDRKLLSVLGDSYIVSGILELYQGNITRSRESFIKSMKLKEKGRDLRGKIRLLHYLAILSSIHGHPAQSRLLHEAAIRLCRSFGIHRALMGSNLEDFTTELMLESFPPPIEQQVLELLQEDAELHQHQHVRHQHVFFRIHLARILMRETEFEHASRYLEQALYLTWKNQTSIERQLVVLEWIRLFIIKNDPNLADSLIKGMKTRRSISRLDNIRLLFYESLVVLQKIIHDHNCQLNHESIQLLTNIAHNLSKELDFVRKQGLHLMELEMAMTFILIAIISSNYPKHAILDAFDRFNKILKEKPALKSYKETVQATFTSLFITIEPQLAHMTIEHLPNMTMMRLNRIFRAFVLPTSLHLLKQITNSTTKKDIHLHDLLSQTFIVSFWFNTTIGPEILCSENTELFGNIEGVLQYMASTLILAIGQGSGYHEGTYGPLPFQLSNDPDVPKIFSCMVHSRKLPLQEPIPQNDPTNPQANIRFVLFTFVFPKELLFNSTTITFKKIDDIFRADLREIKDLSQINEDLLFILRHHLLTVFL